MHIQIDLGVLRYALIMSDLEKYLKQAPNLQKVVVGYLLRDNEVLLGERKKVSLGLGQNIIAGIGGKVEGNETNEEALEREFLEEINVQVESLKDMGQVTFLFPHKEKWNQLGSVFVINKWSGEPQETEVIRPQWFKKDKLPKKQMWEDNPIWIPEVLEGKKINGVILYDSNTRIKEYILEEINP